LARSKMFRDLAGVRLAGDAFRSGVGLLFEI
jgi:hypothetical protein